MTNTVLYISMLGEKDVFNPEDFTAFCPTGLERDWILDCMVRWRQEWRFTGSRGYLSWRHSAGSTDPRGCGARWHDACGHR